MAVRGQEAAGGARVASWPSGWRVGSAGWAAPEGTAGTYPYPLRLAPDGVVFQKATSWALASLPRVARSVQWT